MNWSIDNVEPSLDNLKSRTTSYRSWRPSLLTFVEFIADTASCQVLECLFEVIRMYLLMIKLKCSIEEPSNADKSPKHDLSSQMWSKIWTFSAKRFIFSKLPKSAAALDLNSATIFYSCTKPAFEKRGRGGCGKILTISVYEKWILGGVNLHFTQFLYQ